MFSYVQIKINVGLMAWCVFYNCASSPVDCFLLYHFFGRSEILYCKKKITTCAVLLFGLVSYTENEFS